LGGLVAAVAVPLLLLSVGLYLARARTEQQEARETALRIAKATAARMSRLRADSNAMLQRMALPPSVRDVNAHSCDSLFAIIDFFPKYANLFLFDANAVLVCAAQPQAEDQKVSAVARQWIERELRARRLTPGATQILPVDREWVSITSVAVTNARGAITGTLVLLELPEVFGLEALPAGAVVTIVDRNGTIVARTADHVHWTGRNVRERPVTRIAMRMDARSRLVRLRRRSDGGGDGAGAADVHRGNRRRNGDRARRAVRRGNARRSDPASDPRAQQSGKRAGAGRLRRSRRRARAARDRASRGDVQRDGATS
jgi:hypothetical protein